MDETDKEEEKWNPMDGIKMPEEQICVLQAVDRYGDDENKSSMGLNTYEKLENGAVAIYRDTSVPIDPLHYLLPTIADIIEEGDEIEVPERKLEEWTNEEEKYAYNDKEQQDKETYLEEECGMVENSLEDSDEFILTVEEARQGEENKACDDDDPWYGSWRDLDLNEKIRRAQQKCKITQDFIKLIERKTIPLDYEVQSRPNYASTLGKEFKSLIVINDTLFLKSTDGAGDKVRLRVIPPSFSKHVIKEVHEEKLHVNTWRLLRYLADNFFIHDLKVKAKQVQAECVRCALSANPVKARARNIKTFFNKVGYACSVDLLYMPLCGSYKFLLVLVDLATAFIQARKLRSRDGQTVAYATLKLMSDSHTMYKVVTSDGGVEFNSRPFQKLMADIGANHIVFNEAMKSATGSVEAGNRRLLNLLRRSVGEYDKPWTELVRPAVLALNSSLFLYKNHNFICTPMYLQNARNISQFPQAEESSLARRTERSERNEARR